MRVDRFLSNLPRFNRKQVRLLLVEKRVRVDGVIVSDPHAEVREFSRVEVNDEVLQTGKPLRHFMLNKPAGCVSATHDPQHPTVLDLIHEPDKDDLHIAGRLDFNTTGLMLITNDGRPNCRRSITSKPSRTSAPNTRSSSAKACTSPSRTSPRNRLD
jgi:16S rRNA pseudouridine516 synthase